MANDRKRDGGASEGIEPGLATPGDKNSWERAVDRIPSGEDDDPKTVEPRRGDMSVRSGGPGKRPPREPHGGAE